MIRYIFDESFNSISDPPTVKTTRVSLTRVASPVTPASEVALPPQVQPPLTTPPSWPRQLFQTLLDQDQDRVLVTVELVPSLVPVSEVPASEAPVMEDHHIRARTKSLCLAVAAVFRCNCLLHFRKIFFLCWHPCQDTLFSYSFIHYIISHTV